LPASALEALTSVPGGVNFRQPVPCWVDHDAVLNLEGNTTIGNVTVGDTVGAGLFSALTINSMKIVRRWLHIKR
jgi:hypothetical protein